MPDAYQTFTVPMVGPQTAASNEAAVSILDRSLTYIQNALNSIAGQISESGLKCAIIRHDVPIGPDVFAGSLVYYNSDPGHTRFEAALAELEALPGDQGQSIESPKARVEGLIIRIDNSQATGTLLCGGYYEGDDIAAACLGDRAEAGTYYLSPTVAGMATKDTHGLLRQPVLTYYGDGKIGLSLFYLAHDNHFHTTAVLPAGWTAAGDDAPVGAFWEYDVPTLLADRFIGEIDPVTTAVFMDGILQPVSDTDDTTRPFAIANGKLYYRNVVAPSDGSVTIFNHFPFAYNSSVVRSIQSANENMLRVDDANGIITLTPFDFVAGGSAPSATAIASIAGGTVGYTPVVSGINAGPGTSVSRDMNGVTTVSLKTLIGDQIDAHSIQNNGSTVITDGVLQFFTFPAGRTSEFVMFLPVTDVPEGIVLQASAWGTLYGPTVSLDVNGYFIEQPSANGNTLLPDTTDTTNTDTLAFSSGQEGELSYAEVPLTGCTVTAPGMLVARVRPNVNPPANNIQLLRVGFKLDIAQAPSNPTTPTESNGMITQELPAAGIIKAGQPVFINSAGLLTVCMANQLPHAGRCVGIALTPSSGAGTAVTYVISGVTKASLAEGASLIPGTPVYIDTDGNLISMTSQAEIDTFYERAVFLQRVGTAVSNNHVQVQIESAILKGA
jgi:hypothetical protein